MSTTADQVSEFVNACADAGFSFYCKPGLVTIRKSFAAGDAAAYVRCDGDGPSVLALVPCVSAGSTWGTDGASVGGAAGLSGGYYRLNVSGVSKRFTTALAKLA